MVLDAALLNTYHYKVRIKGKVEQPREWSSALPQHPGVVAIEKESLWVTLDQLRFTSQRGMLRTVLNKSGKQVPTKRHRLCCHLPLISDDIQMRRTRHARHLQRSKHELISNLLYGLLHMDMQGLSEEQRFIYICYIDSKEGGQTDLPGAMDSTKVRELRVVRAIWWYIYIYIYIYIYNVRF